MSDEEFSPDWAPDRGRGGGGGGGSDSDASNDAAWRRRSPSPRPGSPGRGGSDRDDASKAQRETGGEKKRTSLPTSLLRPEDDEPQTADRSRIMRTLPLAPQRRRTHLGPLFVPQPLQAASVSSLRPVSGPRAAPVFGLGSSRFSTPMMRGTALKAVPPSRSLSAPPLKAPIVSPRRAGLGQLARRGPAAVPAVFAPSQAAGGCFGSSSSSSTARPPLVAPSSSQRSRLSTPVRPMPSQAAQRAAPPSCTTAVSPVVGAARSQLRVAAAVVRRTGPATMPTMPLPPKPAAITVRGAPVSAPAAIGKAPIPSNALRTRVGRQAATVVGRPATLARMRLDFLKLKTTAANVMPRPVTGPGHRMARLAARRSVEEDAQEAETASKPQQQGGHRRRDREFSDEETQGQRPMFSRYPASASAQAEDRRAPRRDREASRSRDRSSPPPPQRTSKRVVLLQPAMDKDDDLLETDRQPRHEATPDAPLPRTSKEQEEAAEGLESLATRDKPTQKDREKKGKKEKKRKKEKRVREKDDEKRPTKASREAREECLSVVSSDADRDPPGAKKRYKRPAEELRGQEQERWRSKEGEDAATKDAKRCHNALQAVPSYGAEAGGGGSRERRRRSSRDQLAEAPAAALAGNSGAAVLTAAPERLAGSRSASPASCSRSSGRRALTERNNFSGRLRSPPCTRPLAPPVDVLEDAAPPRDEHQHARDKDRDRRKQKRVADAAEAAGLRVMAPKDAQRRRDDASEVLDNAPETPDKMRRYSRSPNRKGASHSQDCPTEMGAIRGAKLLINNWVSGHDRGRSTGVRSRAEEVDGRASRRRRS
eukprot:TRINITY_DN7314_c0_g2_i1.p1 TRINITY_DN7314_c0_g2~~TRINITY_DN7314_c0_g2_i1.p1  ORF type:complete len:823 (+),score=169.53 TRINITY_DN7314_c0_g2_i1:113-2581(+)